MINLHTAKKLIRNFYQYIKHTYIKQDILPYESTMPVRELFVQPDETEKLRQKANSLQSLDITKVHKYLILLLSFLLKY